jgi:predicted RNase H-like nuclease (RuvC/YqgF family)
LAAILVGSRDHRTQFWKGAIQGPFHQSLVAIGPVVSEEKIKMGNVDGRTKSDDNSSHGLKARWAKKKTLNTISNLTLRSYVEKLRDKIKQLQEENTLLRTEKYETVVKISKLESELESAKIWNENSRTKLETSVRSLTDENESLREKLSMQQADNEIMSCDFRLLKEKYDTQFNEILS